MKKVLINLLKIGLTVLFIYLATRALDLRKLWNELPRLRPWPAIVGACVMGLGIVAAAWRWKMILRNAGVALNGVEAVRLTYIGAFFNTFLPSDSGGDLVKAYYVWKQHRSLGWGSVATVLIDRLVGLVTMLDIAAACLFWERNRLAANEAFPVVGWLLGMAAALGTCLLFILLRRHSCVQRIWGCLPQGLRLRRQIARVWETYDAIVSKPGRYADVFLASVVSQVIFFLGAFGIAWSLEPSLGLLNWFVYFPIIMAASVLPVTFSGLGLREYLFVALAGALGFGTSEAALTASLLIFAGMLLHNGLGGMVYLLSDSTERVPRNGPKGAGTPAVEEMLNKAPSSTP